MNFIKNNLKLKISLLVVTLLAGALTCLALIAIQHEKKRLQEVLDLRSKLLLKNFSLVGTQSLLYDNRPRLIAYCRYISKIYTDISEIFLVDSSGIIYAHNQTAKIGKESTFTAKKENRTVRIKKNVIIDNHLFHYSRAIFTKKKVIGSVHLIINDNRLRQKANHFILIITSFSIGLLVLCFLIGYTVSSKLIIKPIKRLTAGIKVAASGDFYHRITTPNNDELNILMKTFNEMNESLLAQKKQLSGLFNTVHTLDCKRERDSLLRTAIKIINQIINPRQCVIGLVEDNTVIINEISGFNSPENCINSVLPLPNDIFVKLFHQQKPCKVIIQNLLETFDELRLKIDSPTEEALITPIIFNKKTKGLILCIGRQNDRLYNESDYLYIAIIAQSMAISLFKIETIELAEGKLDREPESLNGELVRNLLLPRKPVKIPGIQICSYYKPVGNTHGNWHGFNEDKGNKRLSVFIGDATGQGTPAVLVASLAHSFIKTIDLLKSHYQEITATIVKETQGDSHNLPLPLDPANILFLLNHVLFTKSIDQQAMTFFAATIDLHNQQICFANAGHEVPILIKKKSLLPQALVSGGPRLGDNSFTKYKRHYADLDPGDVIIWYSSGVSKCQNSHGQTFSDTHLLKNVKEYASLSAYHLCKKIVNDLFTFKNEESLQDDLTLITVKIL